MRPRYRSWKPTTTGRASRVDAGWVAWSDFGFVRQRYAITDKDAQFKMAGEVAASIATAAATR